MRRYITAVILTLNALLFGWIPQPAQAQPNIARGLCTAPSSLDAYPRPKNDNGWGIHWAPGASAQEPAAISFFIGELKQMNMRWVKVINRETQIQMDPVVDAVVGAGMMPIMRVSVDQMSPLYPPEVTSMVRHYRGRGVPYFELYNEPNLLDEWWGGADIDIGYVADVWIPVAHAVQKGGGFPSTPALAPGGHWEDMDFFRRFLAEVRRRAENGDTLAYEVLCGQPGLWLAVHNYGLNHYFDYPRDPVNLDSAPVSTAEIDYYGIKPELVNGLNEMRKKTGRPFYVGDEVIDDSNGFFKFLAYAQIFQEIIGYIPPTLITEGGWLPDERQDQRYPPVTPRFQTNELMRAYRYMQTEAPDWLLSYNPWILCNFACNGTDGRFEAHAWYKGRRESDALPIVAALKSYARTREGQLVRHEGNVGLPWWVGETEVAQIPIPGEGLRRTPLELILDAASRLGQMVFSLYDNSDSVQTLRDPLALTNRYILKNVTSRPVGLNIDGMSELLHLAPYGSAVVEIRPQVVITATEPLTTSADMASRVAVARLPNEGDADYAMRQAGPALAAANRPAVMAEPVAYQPPPPAPPEWMGQLMDQKQGPGGPFARLLVQVEGKSGVPVSLATNTGDLIATVNTGQKAEFGEDVAEFAGLTPGIYTVRPAGLEQEVEYTVTAGPNTESQIRFRFQPPAPPPPPPQPVAVASAAAVPGFDLPNPKRFGVEKYRRLSCEENPFLAILYVSVLDAAGQPLDGINLLFNTPDGQNPVASASGSKGPGQAEFTLIGYAPPGQRREWTIEIPDSSGGSPRVAGIRTDLPDDPCPQGTNRTGHYSYRVVFREGAPAGVHPPRNEPTQIVPATWTFPGPRPAGDASTPLSPLPLSQWPRPKNDNGRGLHYNPTGYFGEDNGYMLDLLVKYHMAEEMDMRWITVYFKDEVQLRRMAEIVKEAGMVGVFRYDMVPYKQYHDYQIKQHIDILREYGLPPYLQLYNEPTVGQEWRTESRNLDLYRRNFIAAADATYQNGGYIGFQDVDVDSLRATLASITAQGKQYLFNYAFFVPHCYGSNHPPAYPYDPLNQTERPGETIYEDYQVSVLCFLKFAQVWQEEAGFVPPMIMGEGGWATSIMEDPRYPRVTMEDHANWHAEMFNWFRTGVLSNSQPLPDYLFAVTPWLVYADFQMHFEENAWFYSRLTGTKHETVEAVRGIPYFVRKFSWGYE